MFDPEANWDRTVLVQQATKHAKVMASMSAKGAFDYVQEIINNNDLVYGVFVDDTYPDGIGVYPIKGRRHFEAIMASGVSEELRTEALPCNDLEQAVAAEMRFDRTN